MKKLYEGGNIGLRVERKILSLIILSLVLSGNLSAQIPINGFCKINFFQIDAEFNSIFTLNYNNDSYTDLIISGSHNNYAELLTGAKNYSFPSKSVKYNFNFAYKFVSIKNANLAKPYYAYISRTQLELVIFSIDKNAKNSFLQKIKFQSYPEYLSAGDINLNGTDELLVSGNAFDGVSVFTKKGEKYKEKKIIKSNFIGESIFIDLSNDGFLDILAFNNLTNDFHFLFNDGSGNFREEQLLHRKNPVKQLQARDMNLDSIEDLLFIDNEQIKILFGDSTDLFKTEITVKTMFYPDKFITGDFNKDGQIDLAYINFKEGTLSVLFRKNEFSFYREIIYFKSQGLRDLTAFYSKFIDGILAINENGKMLLISNLSSFSQEEEISIAPKPLALAKFDKGDNGITDLAVIDSLQKQLILLARDDSGIPSVLYSYNIFQEHSKIFVDDISKFRKRFYLYSLSDVLVEVIDVSFDINKFERYSFYSPGKILDLKIFKKDSISKVLIAFSKDNKLGLSVFQNDVIRFSPSIYSGLDNNFFAPRTYLQNLTQGIYYWKTYNDSLLFVNRNLSGNVDSLKSNFISASDALSIKNFPVNGKSSGQQGYLHILSEVDGKEKYYFNNYSEIFPLNSLDSTRSLFGLSKYFLGKINFSGNEKLSLYNEEENSVYAVNIDFKSKTLKAELLNEDIYAKDFVISNMNTRRYHIIYLNKLKNCITIRPLNEKK